MIFGEMPKAGLRIGCAVCKMDRYIKWGERTWNIRLTEKKELQM